MGSMMNKLKGNKKPPQPPPMQQRPAIQYGQPVPQRPPVMYNQIPYGYGPSYPNTGGMMMPNYSVRPPMQFSYDNDMFLSNATGLPPEDIGHLRMEFYNYANHTGIIDREGFRRLYIASLVNKTWEMIDREAEMAFRNFDTNQTGGLDFNEYMMACARMLRTNPQPPMYSY